MTGLKNTLALGITIIGSFILGQRAAAQGGEIESQTYEIVKEKSIEFPPANKLQDEIQPILTDTTKKKVNYQFDAPKEKIAAPKIEPQVSSTSGEAPRKDMPTALNNFIKLGAGNYGRFLGEGFLSTRQSQDLVLSAEAKHLSAANGPVDRENSANSATSVKLGAKFLGAAYKLEGTAEHSRKNYYFYGYHPQPEDIIVNRDSIRQTTSLYGIRLAFENTDPESIVDYSLSTQLYSMSDRYNATELDWGATLNTQVPISNNFFALFDLGAYVSQKADAQTFNRNLFRVKPMFKFANNVFSISGGINVVNETDNLMEVDRTLAFPIVNLDVAPLEGFHIFAGWNGDIIRNTLRSMLGENQWLAPNVLIANTIKDSDIYAGVKGENDKVNYEAKVSYARYRNFYVFNNSLADTSKFSILYDGERTNVLAISGELGYSVSDLFKTSLRGNYYDYQVTRLEEAWQRPQFVLSWFNSLTVSKKIFITSELYTVGGLKGMNFQSGEITELKTIADLNLKIDYLLTRHFSAFVNLNNLLGIEYQRYLYYPQQGLNFIGGISFSF